MNNTFKKLLSLALCGTFLISAAGCSQGKEDENGKKAVAFIESAPEGYEDHFTVTYDEWHSEYLLRMAAGGYSETGDAEIAKQFREQIVQYLVQEKMVLYLAKEMGISAETLSEEELQKAEKEANEDIESWYKNYEARAIAALGTGYTEEQLRKKEEELFNAFMDEIGLNPDVFYSWAVNEIIHKKYVLKASESVTEQQINDFVQETINTAKDKYENDLAVFEQKYTAFYVPEGTRKVQQIAVLIKSTAASEITAYRKDGDDAKADEILKEELAKVKFRIDEAYAKLEKGEDWTEVQKEYNDETSSNNVDFTVYPKSTTVLQKITDTAMGIKEKGSYSEIFETDKGYFILYYKDDLIMDDEKMKDLQEQAEEFLRDQKAYEPVSEFTKKYPYNFDYELLDIERPASSTTAEAAVS